MIFKKDIQELYPLAIAELTSNGVVIMYKPLKKVFSLIVNGKEQSKTHNEMEHYENSLKHNRYSELERQTSEYNDNIEL